MIKLETPRGLPVDVPETEEEDPSPKFAPNDLEAAARYYEDYGYAVIRGAIDPVACDRLKELWATEIKPSRSFIYRQATAQAEQHVFNDKGWVMNPILNLQSVDPKEFPGFRSYSINSILTNPKLIGMLESILSEDPMIVQSMYFEGNSATWEHQDTYYLDSENVGSMVAAWIALEDIVARAGRFFVCVGSHKLDMGLQGWSTNIADHHEEYIQSVVAMIRDKGLEIRAPKLDKGDVLVWNARTMHGSLNSQDPNCTRQSVTLHAIPASHRFLQLQNRIVPLRVKTVNGVRIHHPKDLETAKARAIMFLESHFPSQFYSLKKLGIRTMIASKGLGAIASRKHTAPKSEMRKN
ncbi:phytanoyl-CoA dioxygenase family protein [Thalassovita mediterranea]|nr:phytanoyl-CoA dioxygenase family protein [Thalassovita mediterranea]